MSTPTRDSHAQAIHGFCDIEPLRDMADRSSPAELAAEFNARLRRLQTALGQVTPIAFEFGPLLALLGEHMHTECCIVRIAPQRATIVLHEEWRGRHSVLDMFRRTALIVVLIDMLRRRDTQVSGEFLCELGDNGGFRSVAFCSSHDGACLVPDPDFFETFGYAAMREEVDARFIAWRDRRADIFWRGSSTGRRLLHPPAAGEADDFRWLQRLDLCARTRRMAHADRLDCGITNLVHIDEPELQARIHSADLMRAPEPRLAFMQHRGAIDIDGNSNAWSGLFLSLLMGCCVLKVGSPRGYRQWYYDKLQPSTNYIPVAADLSDLEHWVGWTLGHDSRANVIAEAGRRLARSITFDQALDEATERLRLFLPSAKFW